MTDDEGDWWVLVERPASGYQDEIELIEPIHAPEGREQAVRLAEEYCRTRGAYQAEDGPRPSRRVFRLSPTSWLVEARSPEWPYRKHFRVSIGRQTEVIEGDPKREPERKKGLFRRGSGGSA